MTGRGRHIWRIALGFLMTWAAPLAAQTVSNNTQPTTVTPPAATDTVGPRELRNFNLGGTVIKRAEPEAATVPAPQPEAAAPRTATTISAPQSARSQPTRKAAPPAEITARTSPSRAETAPRSDPQPAAVDNAPPPSQPLSIPAATTPSIPAPGAAAQWSPWWLTALALAAGGGLLMWRRRQQQRPVTDAIGDMLERQRPPPPVPAMAPRPAAPPRAAPTPRPAPPPVPQSRPLDPADGAIVSRGLTPQIGFEFTPLRAEIDATGAAMLSFELTVINGGGAPARDLLVEAMMINAGPRQDEEISHFFRNPIGRGDRIPMLAPMGRVKLRMRVPLPAERLAPLEIEGRRLLVPLIAVNALYRSVAGAEQKSASFLVGRGGEDGGKMGPFSLDRGARTWTGLSTRQHSAGLQA